MSEDQDIQKQIETLSDAVMQLHAAQLAQDRVIETLVGMHQVQAETMEMLWKSFLPPGAVDDVRRLKRNWLNVDQAKVERFYRQQLDHWAKRLKASGVEDAPSPGEDVQ